jgi:hypothetical protein
MFGAPVQVRNGHEEQTYVHRRNGSAINGPFEIAMMILMPPVVVAFLIWYSKRAESRGWIS